MLYRKTKLLSAYRRECFPTAILEQNPLASIYLYFFPKGQITASTQTVYSWDQALSFIHMYRLVNSLKPIVPAGRVGNLILTDLILTKNLQFVLAKEVLTLTRANFHPCSWQFSCHIFVLAEQCMGKGTTLYVMILALN